MRLPKSKAVYATMAACITLLGGAATTYGAAYKTVTVQDRGQRKTIRGFSTGTVGQFLQKYGIHVSKRDRIRPALDSPVHNNMAVSIVSPKQIKIDYEGKLVNVSTFDSTVGQLLSDENIHLTSTDQLSVSKNTSLTDGASFSIHQVDQKVSTSTQEIPFQTIRRRTATLQTGHQKVVTHGVKGLLQVKTTSVYRDGRKISQSVSKTVVKKPVNAVVEIGTATAVHRYSLGSRSSTPDSGMIKEAINVLATAYTAGGITATGRPAEPGVIAVDPRVIPLGSKVYIPGVGTMIAADTGGDIVGRHIDICMSSRAKAESWGARSVTVYIIN